MNKENTQEQIDALMGEATVQSTGVDWKQRCEELEKQLNSSRVEEGRVRKLSEELKARDEELAQLKATKDEERLLSNLSEEEINDIPPEILNVAKKLVRNGMDSVQSDYDKRMRDYEARMANNNLEAVRQQMLARIDERYPHFRSDVNVGGDKHAAWGAYRRYNQASITDAVNTGDFEAFSYHVEAFYRNHLGVDVPTRGLEAAASDPTTTSAANRSYTVDGKPITEEELDTYYEEVERARDRNDYAEVKRLTEIIRKATMGSA